MGGIVSIFGLTPEGLGSVLHEQGGKNVVGPYGVASLYSSKGGRSINQDSAVLCQGYIRKDGVFCGVFDGHGKDGHKVSRMVRQQLPLLLLDKTHNLAADQNLSDENQESSNDDFYSNGKFRKWEEAIVNVFEEMDKEIKLAWSFKSTFNGATAVVVVKQGEELVIANLGDARAVLGTQTEDGVKAVQLTTDLTAGLPGEMDRITSALGRVFALREEPGIQRAWLPIQDVPGLVVSRSFGDSYMKLYGLICTPVVTHHHITPDDLFLVLATNGIWDVLSNEEVTSIVAGVESKEMAAKAVVDAVAVRPRAVLDDCTVVCLFFNKN